MTARIIPLLAIALFHLAHPPENLQASEDLDWNRKLIAACLILEAADQGEAGLQAVASVIANRAEKKPTDYIKVVTRPYAFSALNEASTDKTGKFTYDQLVKKASKDRNWSLAVSIVDKMYQKTLTDNTFGANHYSRKDELPSWSHGMRATVVIGDHLFFKQ